MEEAWERPPSLYDVQDLPLKDGYLMMRGQCYEEVNTL